MYFFVSCEYILKILVKMGGCVAVDHSDLRRKGIRLFILTRDPNRRNIWVQVAERNGILQIRQSYVKYVNYFWGDDYAISGVG